LSRIEKPKMLSTARLFESVGYRPHDVQREIHLARRTARMRVVSAGRRIGKSETGGHELTMEAFRAKAMASQLSRTGKRHEFWIVGPEYSDAEKEFRKLYDDLTRLEAPMDHPGTYYNPDAGQMDLSMFDGRFQVHAKSAKYPNSLVGEALKGVILAEAAKLKPSIWTKFIRPMLADYARDPEPSWALMTSTPEGKNWFYDQYMRGQDPNDPSWWSKRAPSWANPILFPEGRFDPEIIDLGKDMSEEKFKQEIGAEFTEFVGRVFKRFSEEDNVGSFPYDPRWPLYIATDYGFTNPNVALFVQVDVWDNVWVCGEYYERNRTSEEFARDLLEHPTLGPLARKATLLYPDPEDPGATATLSSKLKVTPRGGTGGLLSVRLDLIRRWLKPAPEHLEDGHPDKKPKLMFDRSCKNSIREMNDYRYADSKEDANTNARENPMKKDDHAPEALGRFFGGHFGQQVKEKSHSRITTGSYTARRPGLRR
jgi:hypothetical protein